MTTQPTAPTDPLDAVSTVDRARQEKQALQDELWAALKRANERRPNADGYALGYVVEMLAPGQLRDLIDAVNRYER